MSNTRKKARHFIWAGITKHGQTGGIVPSQRFLIGRMIAPIPETYQGQIVELGAGSGALTLKLAERCPGARILACEINSTLAYDNRCNLTQAGIDGRVEVLADSAENVLSEMKRKDIKADYIISGIPLGNLSREQTLALLDTIICLLRQDGMYIQFQHSLLDYQKMQAKFSNVHTVLVLLNFPPAVIYYAQR
jgi:phosphatidylethanolamine/phosphatidyl-N-methylethanolamine N-methyltransferase